MEKNLIVKNWLSIVNNIFTKITVDEIIKQNKITKLSFTKDAFSKFISRTVLILFLLKKYQDIDINQFKTFEDLYTYISDNRLDDSISNLIHHGLELEHLHDNQNSLVESFEKIKLYVSIENYFQKVVAYLNKIFYKSENSQINVMVNIIHMLHAFHFDNAFDEFISKIIGISRAQQAKSILTFGARTPDIIR